MFFAFIRFIVRILLYILNGKPIFLGQDNLPSDSYIVIAPHRSWIDPAYLALACHPRKFVFMGKKEIFEKKFFGFLLINLGAFPVDRENPGPSAIKIPVKALKENDKSFMIFPSGTRHSQELKGGAVTIGKLSKKQIVPMVYNGPYTLKDLIKRKRAVVKIGTPFLVERKIEGVTDINAHYSEEIERQFKQLDHDIELEYGTL